MARFLAGKFSRPVTVAVSLATAAIACTAAEVKVEKTDQGAKVTVAGKPFADYLTNSGHQPVIWPIIGPGGQAVTRQYPLDKQLPGETNDHPHHRSLWFSHGSVNGLDFWTEPESRGAAAQNNRIVHRDFVELKSDGETARIVTRNDWMSDAAKVCEDERTFTFGAGDDGRWIDFAIDIHASEGPVTFGDTKEGAFGLRVAGTMAVDAGLGSHILNSRNQANQVAWGQAAEWVNYIGPVDGKAAGIAIFDLPDSFRHPTRWHVRTYGLFAANPFGDREFPPDPMKRGDAKQGDAKIAKGDALRLHYRVLLHKGDLPPYKLDALYKQYGEEAAKAGKKAE